jgi:hypothetical protein
MERRGKTLENKLNDGTPQGDFLTNRSQRGVGKPASANRGGVSVLVI